MSQEALAERADLHRTYVSDIENGLRNISLENIQRLSRALDFPLSHLFSRIESGALSKPVPMSRPPSRRGKNPR